MFGKKKDKEYITGYVFEVTTTADNKLRVSVNEYTDVSLRTIAQFWGTNALDRARSLIVHLTDRNIKPRYGAMDGHINWIEQEKRVQHREATTIFDNYSVGVDPKPESDFIARLREEVRISNCANSGDIYYLLNEYDALKQRLTDDHGAAKVEGAGRRSGDLND